MISVFTFHYVSIKTITLKRSLSSAPVFTFHYVSIKTYLRQPSNTALLHLHSTMYLLKLLRQITFIILYMNLHSTMYLLKPALLSSVFMSVLYLHSTMYLLKRVAACCYTGVVVFTFHYVSIKTLMSSCSSSSKS